MEKYAAVILGAGKGTRMNEGKASPIPKVMFEILGTPVIKYSVELIKDAGIKKVVVVVGYKKEMVMNYLGDQVEYAEQSEQLGTGHAARCAEKVLRGKVENIIVFYGDNPLFEPKSIKKLIAQYENPPSKEKPTIGMLTVIFDKPMFWGFGRVIRDKNGEISKIIEQKDCNTKQLKIKECNPGFYIFNADWFWQNAGKIKAENVQKEYYLTDMIAIAKAQNKKIIATPVFSESEAHGINTPEQLKRAEEIIKERNALH